MWLATVGLSPALRGTLVAVVPTRDGLVVAADSRSTIGGRFCDETPKLVEVARREPTVVSVPGTGIVFAAPPGPATDLCAWIRTGPRVMDVERFARRWLETYSGPLTSAAIRRLGVESLDEVRRFVRASPDAPRGHAGGTFYTIVVASYDPAARTAIVGVVGTGFGAGTGEPRVTQHRFWTFQPDSSVELINFGLFQYVDEHVLRQGGGFAQRYLALASRRRLVRELPSDEGIAALDDLLAAAARTTTIVPPPDGTGIGGPTDILLLGRAAAPTRVRWKRAP